MLGSICSSILRRGHVRSSCYRRRMMSAVGRNSGWDEEVEELLVCTSVPGTGLHTYNTALPYGGVRTEYFRTLARNRDFPIGSGTLMFRR